MVGNPSQFALGIMAEHKVPQDVEAEDKLLGPFSFRQFLYLLVALGAGALAYFIGTVAMPLALIPMPIALFFLVIALPLKKDQPMETYLAAMIHFYFTPNRRVWDADGQEILIEITNPRIDDGPQVKEIGGAEAAQRLSFLAEVSDTQGWSTRGVLGVPNATNLTDDYATAAVNAPDILDSSDALGRDLEGKLASAEQRRRAEMVAKMDNGTLVPQTAQSYVHEYQTPSTPTQPSVNQQPPSTMPVVDEQAIAAALRQSSQQAQLSYRQATIQPLAPTTVLQSAAPEPTPPPVIVPSRPAVQPYSQPVESHSTVTASTTTSTSIHEIAPAPEPTTSKSIETSPATNQAKPATIENVSTIEPTASVFTPPPSRTVEKEAVIDHDVDTGGGEIEVKLH